MEHHVVIADDNPHAFFILQEVLECQTCKLHHVSNGIKLIELLEQAPFPISAIITDYHMPLVPIEEVVSKIKSSDKFSHIPIHVLSAEVPEYGKESLKQLGIKGIHQKPMELDELSNLLRGILKNSGILTKS